MKKKLGICIDEELYEKIEKARDGVPRSRWINDKLKEAMKK